MQHARRAPRRTPKHAGSYSQPTKAIASRAVTLGALFLSSIAVAIPHALPDGTEFASDIAPFVIALETLGIIAALYLVLVFIKNGHVWTSRNREPKGIRRVYPKILFIPAMLTVFWMLGAYLVASRNLNLPQLATAEQLLRPTLILQFYLPAAILLCLVVILAGNTKSKSLPAKLRKRLPDLTFRGISSGLATLLALTSRHVSDLVWRIDIGSKSATYLLQPTDDNQTVAGLAAFLRLIADYAVIFCIICALSWLIVGAALAVAHQKPSFSLAFTTSLLLALVFNYLIQLTLRVDAQTFGTAPVLGTTAFQVAILTAIILVFYLLINRYVLATVAAASVLGIFTYANWVKLTLRQEPIYPTELDWLKNPGILIGFVGWQTVLWAFLAIVIVTTAAFWLGRHLLRGPIAGWKTRVATATALVVCYFPIAQNLATVQYSTQNADASTSQVDIPILTNFVNFNNQNIFWLGTPFTARAKSLSYVWLRQLNGKAMQEPSGYGKAEIAELNTRYTHLADEINRERTRNIDQYTVIVVLSESLSNPGRIPGITLSDNPLPYIDSVKENFTGGLFYSHGYGGGTANMEAQSLTGMYMSLFGDSVSVMNSDVLPSMPFIPSLSNAFPEKIAFHPNNGNNYNRKDVYQKLGFSHFYTTSGVSEEDTLDPGERLGPYVSDAQVYDDVLAKINPDHSQFFSVITMQNHLPYEEYKGSSTIEATGEGYSDADSATLQNYTRQITETDNATKNFLERLQQIDKPIAVVFYGDHLAKLYPDPVNTFASDPATQYQTDYFIWTNDGSGISRHMDINAAEVMPALLETTNAKVSPYQALLTEAMDVLPPQANSALRSSVELTPEQIAVEDNLKLVQYDLTTGKKLMPPDFFAEPAD